MNMITKNIPAEYPEINFCDTDTAKITETLISGYETITKKTLFPADPVKIFILWIADIISQERELINYSAKMNLPRYAAREFLDSLAEIFYNVHRLPAEAATTMLRFEISIPLEEDYAIPGAIQVTADGNTVFETTEAIVFPKGQLSVNVLAVCLTGGEDGNGFIPGQICKLVDEEFMYFKSVSNITESGGGTEEENDTDFYNRMRESVEGYSTAGPKGGYIYHGKSVSSAISDIMPDSTEPGVADIRIMLHDGKIPGEEIINKVAEKLSADDVRPMCDYVRVGPPETVSFKVDFTYYTSGKTPTSEITQNVNTALQNYIAWQTEKMGRDINPSKLYGLLMQTGVKRIVIKEPQYKILENKSVAILTGEPQAINGGMEDE